MYLNIGILNNIASIYYNKYPYLVFVSIQYANSIKIVISSQTPPLKKNVWDFASSIPQDIRFVSDLIN